MTDDAFVSPSSRRLVARLAEGLAAKRALGQSPSFWSLTFGASTTFRTEEQLMRTVDAMEGAGASLTSLTLKAGDMAHCVTMNLYMVGLRGQRLKFAVPGNPVQVSSSAMGVAPARRIS